MPALRLALLFALAVVLPAQAQIYKWVDANGQTHFGSQPPSAEPRLQQVRLHAGEDAVAALPALAQASTGASAGPSPDPARLESEMCRQALQSTHEKDIPTLRATSEERLKSGQIDQQQYAQMRQDIEQIKVRITLPRCLVSQGEERERFECLAKGLGLAACNVAVTEGSAAPQPGAQP